MQSWGEVYVIDVLKINFWNYIIIREGPTVREWKNQLNILAGMNLVKEVKKTMEESKSSRDLNP